MTKDRKLIYVIHSNRSKMLPNGKSRSKFPQWANYSFSKIQPFLLTFIQLLRTTSHTFIHDDLINNSRIMRTKKKPNSRINAYHNH